MASVIAAGTTSGTSLNLSADTSGVLQLATNGTTTAVTIDTSQNVGIGTASPNAPLHVTRSTGGVTATFANTATSNQNANINAVSDNSTAISLRVFGSAAGSAGMLAANSTMLYTSAADLNILADNGSGVIKFATGGTTERMRITSSGLVGIGTSSPNGAVTISTQLNALSGTSNTYGLHLYPAPSGVCYVDALTNSSSNSALALRSYNNGTYHEVRLNQNGNLALPGGAGGVTGVGITFPATQSASSDANTLDDYEEGTWTPTPTFGGASTGMTYAGRGGIYTKIGNVVYFVGWFEFTNKGSSTGNAIVTGLPFTSGSTFYRWRINIGYATMNTAPRDAYIQNSQTSFLCITGSDSAILTDTAFTNSSQFYFSGWYQV